MFCFKCGKPIDADSVYCRFCGVKIPESPDATPAWLTNNSVPEIIEEKAQPGHGVSHFTLDGIWEASARTSEGNLKLRFKISEHEPFSGWLEVRGRFGKVLQRDEILGNCHLVMDGELLLGLQLDGRRNGEAFNLRIPVDSRSGSFLIGKDAQGEIWTSHNIQPAES